MTKEEGLKKLKSAKKRAAKLKEEIHVLTEFLLKNGVDLDGSKMRKKRNQKMYRQYVKGIPIKEIAEKVALSDHSVRMICQRIEYRLNK